MPAELAAVLVHDRAGGGLEPLPLEEGAIVVAGEEAGLLALAPLGNVQAGRRGLGSRLRLRLAAERELDPLERGRIERREHVGLVLVRIGRAREEATAAALDDPRVVAGREPRGAGPVGEREQLVEAKVAVAAAARVRRLAASVCLDEGRDDRAPEVLAQIERHVGQLERVAGLAGGDHRLRRAAGSLGVRPGRVEPEPQRDADRLRPGAKERDGAVDAAAHRNRDPLRVGSGVEHLSEGVRERVRRERVAGHRGRFEQRQPGERPGEPGRVGVDDLVAVHREPHEGEVAAPR